MVAKVAVESDGVYELALDFGELALDFDELALDFDELALDFDELALDFDQLALDFDELALDFDVSTYQFPHKAHPCAWRLLVIVEVTKTFSEDPPGDRAL